MKLFFLVVVLTQIIPLICSGVRWSGTETYDDNRLCLLYSPDSLRFYEGPTGWKIKAVLLYDESEDGDSIFWFSILENSPLRFKVTVDFELRGKFYHQFDGWVNKEYVFVYLADHNERTIMGEPCIIVYRDTTYTDFRVLKGFNGYKEAQLLDYHDRPNDYRYAKVMFEHDGELIVGYTKWYCGSPLGFPN